MYSVGQSVAAGTYSLDLKSSNASATSADITVTVGFAKSFSPGVTLARHPPLPAAALYRCVSNKCVAAKTGVALDTCHELCAGDATSPREDRFAASDFV